MKTVLASSLVFVIILFVPILTYGLFTKIFNLKEPEKKLRFFIGVIIQKIATTLGFVAIFSLAINTFDERWFLYGLIWFLMYAITEIGQIFLTDYSKKEAIAGIISELFYFPVSAFLLSKIL